MVRIHTAGSSFSSHGTLLERQTRLDLECPLNLGEVQPDPLFSFFRSVAAGSAFNYIFVGVIVATVFAISAGHRGGTAGRGAADVTATGYGPKGVVAIPITLRYKIATAVVSNIRICSACAETLKTFQAIVDEGFRLVSNLRADVPLLQLAFLRWLRLPFSSQSRS